LQGAQIGAGVLNLLAPLTLTAADVCLTSVAYIGPKSRTERPRKTKLTHWRVRVKRDVAHVALDSDTTFKVKRKIKGQLAGGGAYCGGLPHSLLLSNYYQAAASKMLR